MDSKDKPKHPLILRPDEAKPMCSCTQDAERIRALLSSLERHTIGARRAIDELSEIAKRWQEAA
jgi:hypothetical protein